MLKLVIANKLYSSWSMRPWLVLRAFNIAFEEIIIPLRQAESRHASQNSLRPAKFRS